MTLSQAPPIKIGQPFPEVSLTLITHTNDVDAGKFKEVQSSAHFANKRIVLICVPGAFTPTCSEKHLPSFVEHYSSLRAKNVDEIICTCMICVLAGN
jgi:peroxiredoxin